MQENYPFSVNLDVNITTAGTDVEIWFIKSETETVTGTKQVYYRKIGGAARDGYPARACSIRVDNAVTITHINGEELDEPLNVPKNYVDTSGNKISLGGLNRSNINWSYIKIRVETATTRLRVFAEGGH